VGLPIYESWMSRCPPRTMCSRPTQKSPGGGSTCIGVGPVRAGHRRPGLGETRLGEARNAIIAWSADAVIAVGAPGAPSPRSP
jgi:hypothetical protein